MFSFILKRKNLKVKNEDDLTQTSKKEDVNENTFGSLKSNNFNTILIIIA